MVSPKEKSAVKYREPKSGIYPPGTATAGLESPFRLAMPESYLVMAGTVSLS